MRDDTFASMEYWGPEQHFGWPTNLLWTPIHDPALLEDPWCCSHADNQVHNLSLFCSQNQETTNEGFPKSDVDLVGNDEDPGSVEGSRKAQVSAEKQLCVNRFRSKMVWLTSISIGWPFKKKATQFISSIRLLQLLSLILKTFRPRDSLSTRHLSCLRSNWQNWHCWQFRGPSDTEFRTTLSTRPLYISNQDDLYWMRKVGNWSQEDHSNKTSSLYKP